MTVATKVCGAFSKHSGTKNEDESRARVSQIEFANTGDSRAVIFLPEISKVIESPTVTFKTLCSFLLRPKPAAHRDWFVVPPFAGDTSFRFRRDSGDKLQQIRVRFVLVAGAISRF